MAMLTSEDFFKELKALNPSAHIELYRSVIVLSEEDPRTLKYPEGYRFDEKNGLILKSIDTKLIDAYVALTPNHLCWSYILSH